MHRRRHFRFIYFVFGGAATASPTEPESAPELSLLHAADKQRDNDRVRLTGLCHLGAAVGGFELRVSKLTTARRSGLQTEERESGLAMHGDEPPHCSEIKRKSSK